MESPLYFALDSLDPNPWQNLIARYKVDGDHQLQYQQLHLDLEMNKF